MTDCKGFWNMCGCDKCREHDRRLENAPKAEREAAKAEFLAAVEARTQEPSASAPGEPK